MATAASARFLAFLQDYKRILFALLALSAAPPLLSLIVGVGPPWPARNGVSYFTTLTIWLVLPWTYVVTASLNRENLPRRFTILGIVTVLGMLTYAVLTAAFVYDAPNSWNQEASGFLLQAKCSEILRNAEEQGVPLSLNKLVEGAGYDPVEIWVPWTVATIRASLLASWLLFFGCLSSTTAMLIRFLEHENSAEQSTKLDQHIATLPNLPKGIRETLESAGVVTIRDVTKRRENELLAIPGVGKKSVAEIRASLEALDLSLSD